MYQGVGESEHGEEGSHMQWRVMATARGRRCPRETKCHCRVTEPKQREEVICARQEIEVEMKVPGRWTDQMNI